MVALLDLQTLNILVLIGNMTMSGVLVYYYRFRAKIEQKQIDIMIENYEARKCLRTLRKYIREDKDKLMKMDEDEMDEFLEELKHLGEDVQ